MTFRFPYVPAVVLCTLLYGCDKDSMPENSDTLPAAGQLWISYQPSVDDAGFCRPEKETQAANGSNLYMVHGDHRYLGPDGVPFTSVPLQEKVDSSSTVIMNEALPCDQITIELSIDHCWYYDQSRKDMQCPNVQVKGTEGFKTITLLRKDTKLPLP